MKWTGSDLVQSATVSGYDLIGSGPPHFGPAWEKRRETAMSIRILIVEDHALVRQGLAAMLNGSNGLEVVGEAGDGATAIEEARRLDPDVVLMDIGLPGVDGIEA